MEQLGRTRKTVMTFTNGAKRQFSDFYDEQPSTRTPTVKDIGDDLAERLLWTGETHFELKIRQESGYRLKGKKPLSEITTKHDLMVKKRQEELLQASGRRPEVIMPDGYEEEPEEDDEALGFGQPMDCENKDHWG